MAKRVRDVYSRPPLERMMRIHQSLQNVEYPNCTSLGREFGMCARTLQRDIEFMTTRMGLPIEWVVLKNGYRYTRPVHEFPQVPMSEAETFALLVAHKAIAQYHGTPFQQPLEAAFRRLTGQLDQGFRLSPGNLEQMVSFRPFAPDDADLKVFETLTRGLREHRALKFLYRNRGADQARQRRVHPYHVACIENHWYLLAYDAKRRGMRTFALNRMSRTELLKETFLVPAGFDANEYLSGSLSVFKGGDDYEVVADFDAWAADEIRGRRWHRSQAMTELPGGLLRLRLRLNNIEEAERWLLTFGSHATVVRPQALRERLARLGKEFSARYEEKQP